MDNFSKGFFTKLEELGVSPEQSACLYKFADEAAGQGWQDKDRKKKDGEDDGE